MHVASLTIIISRGWITKALIRLRRCAGWYAYLLFVGNKISSLRSSTLWYTLPFWIFWFIFLFQFRDKYTVMSLMSSQVSSIFGSTNHVNCPLPNSGIMPSTKIFYWPFQDSTSFVDLWCFFCHVSSMPLCASVYMCFVVTCWERAGLLALVCGV